VLLARHDRRVIAPAAADPLPAPSTADPATNLPGGPRAWMRHPLPGRPAV